MSDQKPCLPGCCTHDGMTPLHVDACPNRKTGPKPIDVEAARKVALRWSQGTAGATGAIEHLARWALSLEAEVATLKAEANGPMRSACDDCLEARDALRVENAALKVERDAAFRMSKCECSSDEACVNLAKLHAENAVLRSGIRMMADGIPSKQERAERYIREAKS